MRDGASRVDGSDANRRSRVAGSEDEAAEDDEHGTDDWQAVEDALEDSVFRGVVSGTALFAFLRRRALWPSRSLARATISAATAPRGSIVAPAQEREASCNSGEGAESSEGTPTLAIDGSHAFKSALALVQVPLPHRGLAPRALGVRKAE